MPQSPPDDEARGRVERLRAYAAEAGRDPADVGIEARITLGAVPEKDWAAFADGWRELGATHLCVNTMYMGLSKPEDHAAVLRDVLPLLQDR
jgi:alkanesulfonate monooxygenase SsuD/methylene tetrahydromethanopterin reductase-like flavin-dependent oxidoreductase (luciferase family)